MARNDRVRATALPPPPTPTERARALVAALPSVRTGGWRMAAPEGDVALRSTKGVA